MNFQEFKARFENRKVEEYPNSVGKKPLVSVCVITYQHAPYIRDCLDGILMQETDFSFEILLGEDQSSDGTREICIEYAKKHPDKIRLFLHHRENNMMLNSFPDGKFNFLYNLGSIRGKYIALCEGDDFWTDKMKLQKQVDFLNGHPEYSMSSHETYQWPLHNKRNLRSMAGIFYHNYKIGGLGDFLSVFKDALFLNRNFWKKRRSHTNASRKRIMGFEEMFGKKWFISLHSLLFRREVIQEIPDHLTVEGGAHEFMILYGLLFGKNYHFPDIMGVKRDQPTSITKNKKRKEAIKAYQLDNKIKRYKSFYQYAKGSQIIAIDRAIAELYRKGAAQSKENGDLENFKAYNEKIEVMQVTIEKQSR